HRIAVGGIVCDALEELEELRGADDRVRDRRVSDQPLLGDLRAEVAAVGHPVAADDRQRDVMTYTRYRFGGKEIGRRRLEELQHSRVFERRGVRHVDDDVGTVEGGGHALAGERVDARVRRCRHGLMALFSKVCDDLRPDAPGSADDDAFHGVPLSAVPTAISWLDAGAWEPPTTLAF